jgi:hypothetical protein
MLNDIFATSMAGEYTTRDGGTIVEQGSWSYQGYGNAEITMKAEGESNSDRLRFTLLLHSSERQLNTIEFNARWSQDGNEHRRDVHADIAGYQISLREGENDQPMGNLTAPDEAIYDGPSPIWLIHLMMTALPPVDREVTTPVIYFDAMRGALQGEFYRVSRKGLQVSLEVLDDSGERIGLKEIELSDDGCPRRISIGECETEISRIPHPTNA